MHIGEQIESFVSRKAVNSESCDRCEAVVRHGRSRIVDARVVQPGLQPFGFHLVADPRQFWPTSPPHHVSGGVCTRGRKRRTLAVQAGSCRWIGAFSFTQRRRVSGDRLLLAIRNAEISRASGSLNLKFGMVR